MGKFGIRTELLSSRETQSLSTLNIELYASGIEFHRRLNWEQMRNVGQILMDLKYRTNDEENHINFVIGDWMIQADDWFGTGRGLGEALHLERFRIILVSLAIVTKTRILRGGSTVGCGRQT